MINTFSQYIVEEERVVYFTFGRMNPPTVGHGKLLDTLAKKAGRNPYKVFLSQSTDAKKNPLSYSDKIKHTRKMFPKHARSIMINKKVRTAIEALVSLHDEGYRKVVMVVGSDRLREFDVLLNKYNGVKARHGFYNFKSIDVISAGARDPDAEGVEGMSASKQRANAADNDFTAFAQGLPKNMSNADARRLFNDVRKGMGLKEAKEFKRHLQLDTVSETREKFVKGDLFELGEQVIIKKTDEVGTITVLGSNYVIVETADRKTRQWLDAVEKIEEKKLTPAELKKREKVAKSIERDNPDMPMDKKMAIATSVAKKTAEEYKYEWGTDASTAHAKKMTPGQTEDKTPQDKDIADRKGTQPARYHKGLSRATKVARDRQFKKQSKMSDSDPAAYKPAPGDKTAKTKPSKYTKFVNRLMDEKTMRSPKDQSHADQVKTRIDREKSQDKKKHDRMMDRARMRDTKLANMQEASFADKSKASGISVGTLKKVYDRGVAAWKTGHRPGTTPSQWGHARVNAFIKKKKQGGLNHDKDLA